MAMIDESTAWEILHRYVQDCLQIDSGTLLAVYAIGSLPAGYYRPGQSDIDAILIVENGSEHIWGNSEELSKPLEELNRKYLEMYKIPKDFGPFPLQERELFPPYNPERVLLTLEIARLKLQGKCIHGSFDLDVVPMPTAEDFLRDAQHFEEWWRDKFSKSTYFENMSPTACVNTILMHLSRFLQVKRGIIEFDKRKIVQVYLENDPPFVDGEVFRLVEAFLELCGLSEAESQRLRQYARTLRVKMNAYLGISV
jgi:predicted nucleotidyltransferase